MSLVGIYLGANSQSVSNIHDVLETWVNGLVLAGYDVELLGGDELPPLARENATIRPVSDGQTPTPFGKIADSYRHVSRYASEYDPDLLIQLWKYQTHALGVTLAGTRHCVPTVVRFTGDVFNEYNGSEFPRSAGIYVLDNIVGSVPVMIADSVVSLGPTLSGSIRTRGVDSTDIYVLPPPRPDDGRFFPATNVDAVRDELGLDSDRPIALYVGRLSAQKGMDFFEQVIKRVTARTDYQFVLVGDGPYREKFQDKFSDENVVIPGYVSPDRIGKYYRAATVYVHPSRFEGVPLVILEALQSSVPVVARNAGDIGFVVEETVETVDRMVEQLIERDWNETWLNEALFDPTYQRETIARIVENAIR
ncbi:glycosyltransferase [Halobacterium salinarum]|uniref:glycosyltransferase n=1 Tax=Halobacterium salinarum TaxID=2242 RepID=UPI0025561A36|nr:glycosyltransferase [Halobacterium salinarum]MDL0131628.1 glycosyltransferase [Halobacterium salinarum]